MYSASLETTVVSYFTARASRDVIVAGHQQTTHQLWQRLNTDIEPFVSALVIAEAGQGNEEQATLRLSAIESFPIIPITEQAEDLAQKLLFASAVPNQYPEDALHIALATMGGMDFLLTWNFAHINNPFTRTFVRRVIERNGYQCPESVSPDAMLGDET